MSSLALIDDAELEVALRDLGAALAAPPPRVDLARAARLRIEAAAARPDWAGRLFGRPVRRSFVVALAAVLLLASLVAALGLGLPGLRIILVGETPILSPSVPVSTLPSGPPSGSPTSLVEALRLGRPVPLDSLDAEAGFHVSVPTVSGLDSPLAAVTELAPGVAQASLVYLPTLDYPARNGQPASILVTEVEAALDEAHIVKFVGPGTTIESVLVDGDAGYWLSGAPHQIGYLDRGQIVTDSVRVAGNVLVWHESGITYRIEGASDLGTAQAIAASLR